MHFELFILEWAQTKGTTHNGEKVLLANTAGSLPPDTTFQDQTPSTEKHPTLKHSETTSTPPPLDNLYKYISTISAGRSEEEEFGGGGSTFTPQTNRESSEIESSENKSNLKDDSWSNSEESSTLSSNIHPANSNDQSSEETTVRIINSSADQDSEEFTESTKFIDIAIKPENFSSTLGVYQNCAVCSDREVCSQIGR